MGTSTSFIMDEVEDKGDEDDDACGEVLHDEKDEEEEEDRYLMFVRERGELSP